ncbi:aminoglycoside phosphotransferase family protein [Actinoalloteichus caeruleus]|uniref:aminoglycoside phosphotransferase family protein n=1 Tax=Actinoalloteichus cyanogriseus TaxID=2893586 RepID=UPI0004AB6A6C|nr:aminoglycoside phosphotransferase family protein [Actinoalloteichus caeruleus]
MNTLVAAAPDGRFTQDKLIAVLREVCRTQGLDATGATLLRCTNNAVFRLAADRAVVRIVVSTKLLHRVEKVVRTARWLAEHDVPAVRLLPGVRQPVRVGGHVATLWEDVPEAGPPASVNDLADVLRALHALPMPDHPLPYWAPLDDVRRRLTDAEELADDDRAFLEERCSELERRLHDLTFPLQEGFVHGDAHLGNLISGPAGPVVCDFDSSCVGPREWDLTPMAVGVLRFGASRRRYRQLAARYGFDLLRWSGFPVLRDVRELKLTTSVLPILRSKPEFRPQLELRLRSLREGDATARWTRYR